MSHDAGGDRRGPPWPAANTAGRPVSDVGAGVVSHVTGGPMTRPCLTCGLTAGSLSRARSGSEPRFYNYMSYSHWLKSLSDDVLRSDSLYLIDVTHSLC